MRAIRNGRPPEKTAYKNYANLKKNYFGTKVPLSINK